MEAWKGSCRLPSRAQKRVVQFRSYDEISVQTLLLSSSARATLVQPPAAPPARSTSLRPLRSREPFPVPRATTIPCPAPTTRSPLPHLYSRVHLPPRPAAPLQQPSSTRISPIFPFVRACDRSSPLARAARGSRPDAHRRRPSVTPPLDAWPLDQPTTNSLSEFRILQLL